MGMAAGPGRSSTMATRFEVGGAQETSAAGGNSAVSCPVMCAKITGLAQSAHFEWAGAQASKISCLSIARLLCDEEGDVDRGVVNDGGARDAGVGAGGAAVDHVDADA